MKANRELWIRKYVNMIATLSAKTGIPYEEALKIFYCSELCGIISGRRAGMRGPGFHCPVDLFLMEQQKKQLIKSSG